MEDISSPALSLPLKTIKHFGGLLAGVLWKILEKTRPRRTFLVTEEYINTLIQREILVDNYFFFIFFASFMGTSYNMSNISSFFVISKKFNKKINRERH